MFEPTEEETAMSPKPFLATMTEVIKSGIEVPAAKKVKPITWKITQVECEGKKLLFKYPSRLLFRFISIGEKKQVYTGVNIIEIRKI